MKINKIITVSFLAVVIAGFSLYMNLTTLSENLTSKADCFYNIGDNPNSLYSCRIKIRPGEQGILIMEPAYYDFISIEQNTVIRTPIVENNVIKFQSYYHTYIEFTVSGLPSQAPVVTTKYLD